MTTGKGGQRRPKAAKGAAEQQAPPRQFVGEQFLEQMTEVSAKTWQQFRFYGRGPRYYKIGGAVRYDLQEVLAWIEAGACGPAPEHAARQEKEALRKGAAKWARRRSKAKGSDDKA